MNEAQALAVWPRLMEARSRYYRAQEAFRALASDDPSREEARRRLRLAKDDFNSEMARTAKLRARFRAIEGDEKATAEAVEYVAANRRGVEANKRVKRIRRRGTARLVHAAERCRPLSSRDRADLDVRLKAAKAEARAAAEAFDAIRVAQGLMPILKTAPKAEAAS